MSRKLKTVRKHVRVTGKWDDGVFTLGGVFFMMDTVGVPLEVLIQPCRFTPDAGGPYITAVADMVAFMQDARAAGWPFDRAFKQVREAHRILGWPEDGLERKLIACYGGNRQAVPGWTAY